MKKQKTSSLIRKINGHMQLRRLLRLLTVDILGACVTIGAWCFALESQCGTIKLMQLRKLSFAASGNVWDTVRSGIYQFFPKGSAIPYSVEIGKVLLPVLIILPLLLIIQLICWGVEWVKNERFLRDLMRPIDEAALAAERISAGGIDENRIHNMEKAINSITDSESSIRIGDKDLQGLESAINNLLRRLKASYEEQTRFVDDASHELRTPIAVIQGYASILERWGKDDPAALEESVSAILEESEHMQTLVEQLLFLARGDGGRQNLKLSRTDVNELLQEIKDESEMIDSGHCYIFAPGESVFVMADQAMMKQAVRILTDNAAKYTPDGGKITLSVERRSDGGIGISVKDDGVGLKQEEAAHMFERFFRGEQVRGSTKGSGLGLSIAKWIIERHGGWIEVLGYKDIGTKLTLCLPAVSLADGISIK